MSGIRVFGEVVKLSSDKTVKVAVESVKRHLRHKKVMYYVNNFLCHNELPDVVVGSNVELQSGPRVSKRKSFRVVRVLS